MHRSRESRVRFSRIRDSRKRKTVLTHSFILAYIRHASDLEKTELGKWPRPRIPGLVFSKSEACLTVSVMIVSFAI